ncbi:MAG: ABC transporter permease [Coriobacteriia bacterium]|nr:ABC transporter permease [Coriobacteriia bacterium]
MPDLASIVGTVVQPDLFASAIRMATPLALAAIGGTICERSGVVNIALEGLMLIAAFFGTAVALAVPALGVPAALAPWIGVLGAVLAGVIMSALHGFASITLKSDQVVSGTAINILALGLTGFLIQVFYGRTGTTDSAQTLPPLFVFDIHPTGFVGSLWDWFNGVLLGHTPLVYVTILIAIFAQWAMYRTRWGLRLRALGEHPRAADTVGISVTRGRYVAVLMSGALAGLAGANLSLEQVGSFSENMTSGRGFIALAANIFGRWTPVGSYLASLLFGFAEALEIRLQAFIDVIKIPPQFFLMLPYVLTVVVLAGVMGRAVGPAAVGKPYEKE